MIYQAEYVKKYFASLQFASFQVASETSANGDLLIFQNSRLKWFPKLNKMEGEVTLPSLS